MEADRFRDGAWRAAYRDILEFERMLADDGTVIIKFFLHISRKEQKKRFEKIEADPLESWRVTEERLGAAQEIRPVPGGDRGDAGADRIRVRSLDDRRGDVALVRAAEGLSRRSSGRWKRRLGARRRRAESAESAERTSELRQARPTCGRRHGIAGRPAKKKGRR